MYATNIQTSGRIRCWSKEQWREGYFSWYLPISMSRRDPLRFEVQNEYLGHQLMSIFNLCCVICLAYFWATPLKKSYNQHRQHIKKQRHYFAYKGPSSQGYGFSSSHVWICYKESRAPKNWCFWTAIGEDSWESLGLQGDPTSPS